MIPHSRPTLSDQELEAVAEVFRSCQLACGPKVQEFEYEFARRITMPEAVAVNSGTSGLHLALCALGIGAGDEVIIPSYVCSALLNAVLYVGATPVVVDSLPGHGHMDNEAARRKISKKTKAVILVHLFGDITPVREWKDSGLRIIEDGTQSLGNKSQEGVVGSLGDLSIFSFYATKVITTGEGGMIGVRDPYLAAQLRDLREYDEKSTFKTRYNYKMTDLSAVLGLVQLGRLSSFLESREKIADQYDKVPSASSVKRLNQSASIYYRYVLSCEHPMEQLLEHFKTRGIQCKRPVFAPVHRLLNLPDEQFPWATRYHASSLSIPIYPSLQECELDEVCQALREIQHVEIH